MAPIKMTTTKLTLSDYLASDYLAAEVTCEGRREFVDGEIVEMPPESPENLLISLFLLCQFLQILPFQQLRRMDTELVVAGRVRIPDLVTNLRQSRRLEEGAAQSESVK